ANPIRTLRDYSKPSHEGYRNNIELPVRNNMVPLRSDTIRKADEEERERYGNPEDTNIITHNEEQRDTPQLELKDTTVVDNLGPNMNDEGIEWLDVEEPLDLVDISEESVYESLIK
nr:hypothetical protein [Tanacetum cinerariifolium]